MHTLVRWRYHQLKQLGVYSSVERVASVGDDVADGVSRRGAKLRDALQSAAAAGMPLVRLSVAPDVRCLDRIRDLS